MFFAQQSLAQTGYRSLYLFRHIAFNNDGNLFLASGTSIPEILAAMPCLPF
jgi:hypothetical protein